MVWKFAAALVAGAFALIGPGGSGGGLAHAACGQQQAHYMQLVEALVDEDVELLLALQSGVGDGSDEYNGEYVQLTSMVAGVAQDFEVDVRAYDVEEKPVDNDSSPQEPQWLERQIIAHIDLTSIDTLLDLIDDLDSRSEPVAVRHLRLRHFDDGYDALLTVATFSVLKNDVYHQQRLGDRVPLPRVQSVQERLFDEVVEDPEVQLERLEIDTERQLVMLAGATDSEQHVDEMVAIVEQFEFSERVDLERAQVVEDGVEFEVRIATDCS